MCVPAVKKINSGRDPRLSGTGEVGWLGTVTTAHHNKMCMFGCCVVVCGRGLLREGVTAFPIVPGAHANAALESHEEDATVRAHLFPKTEEGYEKGGVR